MMSCIHRQEDFDLVLSQSALDRCCYELTAFVDMFLGETIFEPVLDPTNVMVRAASIIRTAVSSLREMAVSSHVLVWNTQTMRISC